MKNISITTHNTIIRLMEMADLESLHTKTLIKMLRYERKNKYDYDNCDQIYDNRYNMLQFRLINYGQYIWEDVQRYKSYIEVKPWKNTSVLEYTYADEEMIRGILKTRPNTPNKEERKEMTRQMIARNRRKTKRNLKFTTK